MESIDENEPSEEVSERPEIDLMLSTILPVVTTSMLVMDCKDFTISAQNIRKKQLMIYVSKEFPLNMLATTSKI